MRRIKICAVLVLLCVGASYAQSQGAMARPQLTFMTAPVKGAPYCAQETSEHTQKLADGTNIDRKSVVSVCRDSEGRERRETEAMISIMDPVAGVSYHLNKADHSGTRGKIGVLQTDKLTASQGGAVSGAGGVIRVFPMPNRVDVADAGPVSGGRGGGRGDGTMGARGGRGGAANSNETNESLGVKTIEGVEAEGTRTTRVIPAGQIGNDRPIQSVFETWFSTELHAAVLRRTVDPMNGTTVTQLTGIQRSEPDPAVFRVPADYALRDLGQN